ncbi:6-bladed beta-propeller [candidate division KSB1 bacterium]
MTKITLKNYEKMKKKIILFLILNSLFIFCTKPEDNSYILEEIDGVSNIHNTKEFDDTEYYAQLKLIREIGDIENEDDNYNFFNVTDITKDVQGNFYITEIANNRIQVLDPTGKYMRTIGNEGFGPGELYYPRYARIINDSLIFILNQSGMRIDLFSTNGNFKKTINTNGYTSSIFPLDRNRIVKISTNLNNPKKVVKVFSIIDDSGVTVCNSGIPFFTGDDIMDLNLNSCNIYVDKNKNIFIVYRYQNRIEKYNNSGILQFKCDRLLNYPIEQKYRKMMLRKPEGRVPRDVPDYTDVSDRIGIDNRNNLWIATNLWQDLYNSEGKVEKYAEPVLEIFNDQGILLGWAKHPENESERLLNVIGKFAYFTNVDKHIIREYEIIYN